MVPVNRNTLFVFLWCLSLMGFSAKIFGATVVEVNARKRTVKIDAGKNIGLMVGDIVCFVKANSQKINSQKAVCGNINFVDQSTALVAVNKKSLPLIKSGMTATTPVRATASSLVASKALEASKIRLSMPYVLSPVATYHHLLYETPVPPTSAVSSLWKRSGKPSVYRAIGVDAQFGVLGTGLSLGAKYAAYRGYHSDSFYDSNPQNAALTDYEATAIAAWVDAYYLSFAMGPLIFSVGNGLEYNQSTLKFTATHKNDVDSSINQPLATLKSDLSVIALRSIMNAELYFGSFGFGGGVNLLVPFYAKAKPSAAVQTPHKSQYPEGELQAAKDLEKSLQHDKSQFGLELILSAVYLI
jgi:hypothetical protein